MARARYLACGVAAIVLVATAVPAGASTSPVDEARDALRQRVLTALANVTGGGSTPAAGRQTREVGNLALDAVTADVWVHGDHAYLGSWAAPCGLGVRIVDVSDPANPEHVATAATYDATSAEDIEVMSVDTASFTGDLMGVGLQDCGGGLSGLDLWDVTDPTSPAHLGFYPNFGVHELGLTARSDGVFALLASPFSEPFTFFFAPPAVGDFQLVDVSDPANPVLTDDWGALKDGGFPAGAPDIPAPYDCSDPLCRGSVPLIFAHSASPSGDGDTAYVAYWDLGGVVLDISDPTDIQYVGRTVYPAASEGDTHSAVANGNGSLLATTDEDFSPEGGKVPGDTWGFGRLWSIANPASPVHLSDVTTPHSLTNKTNGFYSVHNPVFNGDKLYLSWYSDGVRVFDISSPTAPREIAFYKPQPSRGVLAPHPIPLVWGVVLGGDRMYLSDMFYGLYVVAEK
ncbi:MAG TPA: hypothetical protein VFR38_16945 [Gaiellaceae bacterium]|nr:hypothetical protein [Gaiellaceae bacterium]